MTVANLFDPHFDDVREDPGFTCRRARVGSQSGTERIGASVWEIPPGQAAYPYHFHLVQEELLLVLGGRPSVRTPEGWRDLGPGDTVAFPVGERGGHQLANRSDEPVRVLVVSSGGLPEVLVQPDSGKVGVYEGGDRPAFYRRDDAVAYHDGEAPPQ